MHYCCIRVVHNRVTALSEYLDLLAVFPGADDMLFVTILAEYVSPSLQCKIRLVTVLRHPFFLLFALASYFSKKLLAKSAQP